MRWTATRSRSVKGDRHIQVNGKEAIKITGQHSLSIQGDVVEVFQGNQSTQVTQNISIKGAQVVIEAETGLTISVGSNFITINEEGVTILGTIVNINSGGAPLVGTPGVADSPNAPTAPTDADNASAGSTTTVTPGQAKTPENMSLDSISPTNPQ